MTHTKQDRARIRAFVMSRRARLTPTGAGIATDASNRRVEGLRRAEVAALAGVSLEYYTRFERGDAVGASAPVFDSISRALRLTDVERDHLHQLYSSLSHDAPPVTGAVVSTVRPSLQWMLDAMQAVPAFAVNRLGDLVATNHMGRAFHVLIYDDDRQPPNHTWFHFRRQDKSREFWVDWDAMADNGAQILRREMAGTMPRDAQAAAFLAELLEVPEFRDRWGSHDVRQHTTGLKRVNHPVVGRMDLVYENMTLPTDPDLTLLTFLPPPGTASAEAMRHLAAWARAKEAQHAPAVKVSCGLSLVDF